MTNIDFFKQDVSLGDSVTIELTSGKSVSGKVIEISECVIIEKEDGKKMRLLDGIIGGWEVISHKQTDNITNETELTIETPVNEEPKAIAIPKEEEKKEPQIGLKIVGKIDLSKFDKPKKTLKNNPEMVEESKLRTVSHVTDASQTKTKMKSLGNSFDALASVDKSFMSKGPSLSLTPMGIITRIGGQFGFIMDNATQRTLRFEVKDLIGELSDFSRNDDVIFSIAPGISKGKQSAVKVLNILSVDELIAKAKYILEFEGPSQKQNAKDIIHHILNEYPKHIEANEIQRSHFASDPMTSIMDKPSVVSSPNTIAALPLELPLMTEQACRDKERELDIMIRDGRREECLKASYQLLEQYCPTPKYLKSYLDRIVNTEVALNHTNEAITALAQLIAFSEKQSDTKVSNLSHLYISLARLLKKTKEYVEAEKALNCASSLGGNDSLIQSIRGQIQNELCASQKQMPQDNFDALETEDSQGIESESAINVSDMLQEDVENWASSREMAIDDVDFNNNDADKLFDIAIGMSKDMTKSFEDRAQKFLNAASSLWQSGKGTKKKYKIAVANYARFKGNAMYLKVQNSLNRFPENKEELLGFCDCSCSYYIQAIDIYNGLKQPKFLDDIALKYLKLQKLSSQLQGGKTPEYDWYKKDIKSLITECFESDGDEEIKILAKTCIRIGAASEKAWSSLCQNSWDCLISLIEDSESRNRLFNISNFVEGASFSCDLSFEEFFHSIFEHHKEKEKKMSTILANATKWDFDKYNMGEFADSWNSISNYYGILLPSDRRSCDCISKVVSILSGFADADPTYRNTLLMQSQQSLLANIKSISDNTTYLGRVYFSHIEQKWMEAINESISSFYASKEPKIFVKPDPGIIKQEEGKDCIFFQVSNKGETPANYVSIVIRFLGNSYGLSNLDNLAVGEERVVKWELPAEIIEVTQHTGKALLTIEVTPFFQSRKLLPSIDEYLYEIESNEILKKNEIPWRIENTPPENVFKGRNSDLDKLVAHYKSRERGHTFIMYGLTRTGKSSMLDYLCIRLSNECLDDAPSVSFITFKWNFNNVAFGKENEDQFWEHLILTTIYQTLPQNLKDAINKDYGDCLPKSLRQNDLGKIIRILNQNNKIPFITIDEFSNVKDGIHSGMLNPSFLGFLRDLALDGKACFIYAGTYDIKDLPDDPRYGYTGQLAHTKKLEINAIGEKYADELIDAWPKLIFEEEAKAYIRYLSGCVPYWIQWICLNCGKYAVLFQKHHLGVHEVDEVVRIMTGESQITEDDDFTWDKIDKINFQNNQMMTGDGMPSEVAVISCISYLNRERSRKARGVSIKELENLWSKFNVSESFRAEMVSAIDRMVIRKTLSPETDDGREVYRLSVDLFRRCWYNDHKDINKELTHK